LKGSYVVECTTALQEFKLSSKYQYGFRPKPPSYTYAVDSIYVDLLRNADNRLHSCSIFLDWSKGFGR